MTIFEHDLWPRVSADETCKQSGTTRYYKLHSHLLTVNVKAGIKVLVCRVVRRRLL